MPLVLFHTPKVRQELEAPRGLGVDVLLIVGIAGLIAAAVSLCGHVAAPRPHAVHISLSFWVLPQYAFYSLSRAFIAYGISLVFTLVYGTISAHNRTAERFMIPALDVLQSLPVLSFLPGLVLLCVRLFPASWLGLELACVVMIFTAQAWNMTFSYHGSVRAIPTALREAAAIQHLSGWQIFRYLEVPASMIGLVWNSMMSMAGGWFIITVNEAFTLNGQDYRLPGLGSYMNQAQTEWNIPAMIAGVVAMILMIVAVDQLFWRPIVVWSQRFKLEDTASADASTSWVLDLFQRSSLLRWAQKKWRERRAVASTPQSPEKAISTLRTANAPRRKSVSPALLSSGKWLVLLGLALLAAWGALVLARLLVHLPIRERGDSKGWTTVLLALLLSFGRTTTAVLLGGIWALPAGVLIGLSPKLSNRLQPVVQIVASFPAPMVFPIVVFLLLRVHIPFTIGCIALMLLGTQWYTLFNVIAGAMAIPSDLQEAGNVFHMSAWQRWTRLYVPAVFPYLVTGLITAAGGAWNATIVSEYMSLQHRDGSATVYSAFGLGSLINEATDAGNWPLLAASVVTMGVAVIIINRLVWKRVYRVAEERYTLNN
jgi:NitT/TauT family transport system permease protein